MRPRYSTSDVVLLKLLQGVSQGELQVLTTATLQATKMGQMGSRIQTSGMSAEVPG